MEGRTSRYEKVALDNASTRKSLRSYWWRGRTWILVSAILLIVATVIAVVQEDRVTHLESIGSHTEGVVVDVRGGNRFNEGSIDVSFEAGGRRVTKEINLNSDSGEYEVGDLVEVIYDPNDLDSLMTAEEENDSGWAVLAFVIAFVAALVGIPTGVAICVRARQWRKLMRNEPWREVRIDHMSYPIGNSEQHLVRISERGESHVLGVGSSLRWRPNKLNRGDGVVVGSLDGRKAVVGPTKAGPFFRVFKSRSSRRQRKWEKRFDAEDTGSHSNRVFRVRRRSN